MQQPVERLALANLSCQVDDGVILFVGLTNLRWLLVHLNCDRLEFSLDVDFIGLDVLCNCNRSKREVNLDGLFALDL